MKRLQVWVCKANGLRPLVLSGLLLLIFHFAAPAFAASMKAVTDPKKSCSAIELKGEIKPGDYDKFIAQIKAANDKAPLRRIYLDSPGGNILQGLAITQVIRNLSPRAETIVLPGKSCNSACVVLLSAGDPPQVSNSATVIIHQAFDQKTGKKDAEVTRMIGQYLVDNGFPDDILKTMTNIKPNQQLPITPSSAKKLGFTSFSFFGGSNPLATPGCSWPGFQRKKS